MESRRVSRRALHVIFILGLHGGNGPALEKILTQHTHRQDIQAGVVYERCGTGVPYTPHRCRTQGLVYDTRPRFAAHARGWHGITKRVQAWCKDIPEAIVKSNVSLAYDTGVASPVL